MKKTLNEDEILMYAWAGRALMEAQSMETNLSNLIVVQQMLRGKIDDIPNLKEVFVKHDRQTLGALLINIRKYVKFDAEFETKLGEALKQRNFLVHNYFLHLTTKYNHVEGKTIAPVELHQITQILSGVTIKLLELTIAFASAIGLTPEILNEELRKKDTDFYLDWTFK